tara:strand:- start:50539 stop:50880 length:342 start_codon:yes stop_codon:yes gene_type:complete
MHYRFLVLVTRISLLLLVFEVTLTAQTSPSDLQVGDLVSTRTDWPAENPAVSRSHNAYAAPIHAPSRDDDACDAIPSLHRSPCHAKHDTNLMQHIRGAIKAAKTRIESVLLST